MEELLPHAERIAARLKARKETVAIAESSAGGLVTAALLAIPGASAYCTGGAVLYTRKALVEMMRADPASLTGMKPGSEEFALLKARLVRKRLSTTWGVSENGVAGPTGNRYGFAPGHACVAVSGPIERAKTIDTGETDRVRNMYAFAAAALELLADALGA